MTRSRVQILRAPLAVVISAMAGALLFPAAAADADAGGRTYALLIGLNYDRDEAMRRHRLNYSANDARAVRDMLVAYCGVAPENIEILGDEQRPDAALIRRRIKELAGRAGPADRILLFFSGHGVAQDGAWAMVPYDIDRDDIAGTLCWNRDITKWLEGSPAGQALFLVDACHSGTEKSVAGFTFSPTSPPAAARRNPDADDLLFSLGKTGDLFESSFPASAGKDDKVKSINLSSTKVVRLCSSGVAEIAAEFPPERLGAFTHALTRTVAAWWTAAPADDALNLEELHRRMIPQVHSLGQHTPFLSDNGRAFTLAVRSARDNDNDNGNDKGNGEKAGDEGVKVEFLK